MVRDGHGRTEETNPLMTMKAVTAVEHLTFAQCYLISKLILFFLIKIMLFLLLKRKQSFVIPLLTHA